jgi:hypothetical protein
VLTQVSVVQSQESTPYLVLSLGTIVHVCNVVHKFHIKVFSFVNRFICVCHFEI